MVYFDAMSGDVAVEVDRGVAVLTLTAINGYTPRQVAALETELHRRVMGTAAAAEGVAAFLDRRAPRCTSRLSAEWTSLPKPES